MMPGNVTETPPIHDEPRVPSYEKHLIILRKYEVGTVKKMKLANPCFFNISGIFSTYWPHVAPIPGNVTETTPTQDVFFFFFFFDLGFTALSRIFHLYRTDRSSKVGENRRTRRKTT